MLNKDKDQGYEVILNSVEHMLRAMQQDMRPVLVEALREMDEVMRQHLPQNGAAMICYLVLHYLQEADGDPTKAAKNLSDYRAQELLRQISDDQVHRPCLRPRRRPRTLN